VVASAHSALRQHSEVLQLLMHNQIRTLTTEIDGLQVDEAQGMDKDVHATGVMQEEAEGSTGVSEGEEGEVSRDVLAQRFKDEFLRIEKQAREEKKQRKREKRQQKLALAGSKEDKHGKSRRVDGEEVPTVAIFATVRDETETQVVEASAYARREEPHAKESRMAGEKGFGLTTDSDWTVGELLSVNEDRLVDREPSPRTRAWEAELRLAEQEDKEMGQGGRGFHYYWSLADGVPRRAPGIVWEICNKISCFEFKP
jgi:hypothetical protein